MDKLAGTVPIDGDPAVREGSTPAVIQRYLDAEPVIRELLKRVLGRRCACFAPISPTGATRG
jgi:hypothetical protein